MALSLLGMLGLLLLPLPLPLPPWLPELLPLDTGGSLLTDGVLAEEATDK